MKGYKKDTDEENIGRGQRSDMRRTLMKEVEEGDEKKVTEEGYGEKTG